MPVYLDPKLKKQLKLLIPIALGLLLGLIGVALYFSSDRRKPESPPVEKLPEPEPVKEPEKEPEPPPPDPAKEAERQQRIERYLAEAKEQKLLLFKLFYHSLRSDETTAADEALRAAENAVEKLHEDASEAERAAAADLAETGVILTAARQDLARSLNLIFAPDSQVLGAQYELPDRKIGRITALNSRSVRIEIINTDEVRDLPLSNPVINRELIRRIVRRLQQPELEFFLTLSIGFPEASLAAKAPDEFWRQNFSMMLDNFVPLPVEESAGSEPIIFKAHDLLVRAIYNRQTKRAKDMLELGADPNSTDFLGSTPLMAAASIGDLEVAELLLQKKAEVNAVSITGRSALMNAVTGNHAKLVKLLLDNGADPNGYDKVTGKTIRQLATLPAIIQLLEKSKPAN